MAVYKIATNAHFLGLSTDTKPSAAPVGATFIETDTKDSFICYDGASWTKGKRNSDLDDTGGWRRNPGF